MPSIVDSSSFSEILFSKQYNYISSRVDCSPVCAVKDCCGAGKNVSILLIESGFHSLTQVLMTQWWSVGGKRF